MKSGNSRPDPFLVLKVLPFVFWVSMMGLLVRQEFFPNVIQTTPTLHPYLSKEVPFQDDWMGIYYMDERIGYSHTTIHALYEKVLLGYTFRNLTRLSLPIYERSYPVTIEGFAYVDSSGRLKDLLFILESGIHRLVLEGSRFGDQFLINLKSRDEPFTTYTVEEPDAILTDLLNSPLFLRDLKVGDKMGIRVFDPITLSTGIAWLEVLREEQIRLGTRQKRALVVNCDYKGLITTSWVTPQGHVLKVESPLGLIMIKEPKMVALMTKGQTFKSRLRFKKGPEKRPSELDLFSGTAIKSEVLIPYPRQVKRMRVALSGADLSGLILEDQRQKLIEKGILEIGAEEIPAKDVHILPIQLEGYSQFLKPEPFVQSDNSHIKIKAKEIVGGETNAWLASIKLMNWLYLQVEKKPVVSLPSAIEVLATMEGDCNEHTVLFTAMARSLGIPTKMCAGVAYQDGSFYYHAWPKVYVGEWVSLDPALGQEVCDATHIQFVEGGLDKMVALAKLIGRLEIKVLEYDVE